MKYLEEIETIAIREIASKLYEDGLIWTIKPNPMRDDGVFVITIDEYKHYLFQVPEEFAKKLVHYLNVELPNIINYRDKAV